MKAIIRLDVPDFQIGEDVTVFFRDTMMKHGVCEADPYAEELIDAKTEEARRDEIEVKIVGVLAEKHRLTSEYRQKMHELEHKYNELNDKLTRGDY